MANGGTEIKEHPASIDSMLALRMTRRVSHPQDPC